MMSELMTGRGPGISPSAPRCSLTNSSMSPYVQPPILSSAITATADAPNSRKVGDRISGLNTSSMKPEPSRRRLYSAIIVMVPLRLVRTVWSGPGFQLVASSSRLESRAAAFFSSSILERTAGSIPSGRWTYSRRDASLALRASTPIAIWRLVDDGAGGVVVGMLVWTEGGDVGTKADANILLLMSPLVLSPLLAKTAIATAAAAPTEDESRGIVVL
mmetsp:Transcript_26773/g.59488  ORF Transcript_26773/g.59488 Transcript_26773/m.59488 type:complete len:217 (+) Transcript_26773:699-1349(+)